MTEERNMFQTVGFRFLICNLLIAGMIGTVMLIQRCAHTSISGRTRYFMWKLMLGVLFIPFIPVPAKWIKAGLPARMAQVLQALLTGLFSGSDNSSDTAAAGVSGSTAPFTAGIGAGIKEMRKRIENIAGYRPSTRRQKMKNGVLILMTAAVLLSGIPALPVFAGTDDVQAGQDIFSDDNVRYIDLSEEMYGYEGTFVLYDEASDEWIVYNEENAMTRISPLSTWKIYDALLGLECGVIAPDDSARQWNGEPWPFDTWERDQDLDSAIEDSVNWYFQSLDREAGRAKISTFLAQIGYGNETVGAGITDYWLDSSLKVSPAEQVVQLKKLFRNEYGFRQENVDAVKNAICLSSAPEGKFYGKTGTARADGEDVNGWFIGAVENARGDSYSYFAVNIQANTGASGSRAAEIAGDVLAYLGVCQRPVTPSTVSVT